VSASRALPAVALAATLLAASATPAAGQAEIVRLSITIAPIVAAGAAIPVTVAVDADRGALSARTDHLRLRVRYAAECAGTFAGTPGPVAIDTQIPDPGTANTTYHATLNGSAAVASLGAYSVCAFLEEEGTARLFAQDADTQFQATAGCTTASRTDARNAAALRTAQGQLAHAKRSRRAALRRRIKRLAALQRAAANSLQAACAG
jgi:hypothetical protein